MDTKLTLKLDKNTIAKMKLYARDHETSLSQLVENFFESMAVYSTEKNPSKPSHRVREITGVVKLKKKFNRKKEYSDYLIRKYK